MAAILTTVATIGVAVKRLLASVVLVPFVTAPFARLTRARGTIFMMHRFRDDERGVEGHDSDTLRRTLALFRRDRYRLVSLNEMVDALVDGRPVAPRSVSFTIDDGYAEQGTLAADVFAEFDCPSTTFVVTGFLDGDLWMWWDRVDHVFQESPLATLSAVIGRWSTTYVLADGAARRRSAEDFAKHCKRLAPSERDAAITALAASAQVDLPLRPPARYAPMTWDQLRAAERRGMSFGSHTVSHPILSTLSDAESAREIEGSVTRLAAEACAPVPMFCFPNGRLEDFQTRDVETLARVGIRAGVTGISGYASPNRVSNDSRTVFMLPRFAYAETVSAIQVASGVERAKQIVRGETDAGRSLAGRR